MSLNDPGRGLGPLGNEGGDMSVRFTVADYIDRVMKVATHHMESVMREVREGFERIDRKLDGKADKAEVEDLKSRVRTIEGRYEPQYFDRVIREHNSMLTDVENLKSTGVTQKELASQRKEMMRPIWALVVAVVSGVIVGIVLWGVQTHWRF